MGRRVGAWRVEVLQEAAVIWQATEGQEVSQRRRAFVTKWGRGEPEVVTRLQPVFGQMVAYLEVLERARERWERWQARYLRTTSPLERCNRCWRQKVRQVGMFHSEAGVKAAFAQVLLHHHLTDHAAAAPEDAWTDLLEVTLLAA